jgi:FkbM family methyltransferase
MQEYIKHLLIRTPLEEPAQKIRDLLGFKERRKHPELKEIYIEPQRTEQVMQRLIGNSFNCIDIGCHLGSTLSKILKLAPQGHHIAFEPLPHKAHWLKRKFPEVDVRELALGSTPGEVTFYYNTNQSGFSGLHQHGAANDTIRELTVKCEQLDNILPPAHRVDFIKLDVEGGELAVLQGAAHMLRRCCPPLLFECTLSGLSNFGFTSAEVFEFLNKQYSYSVFLLKDFIDDGEPLNFEQFDKALQFPFKAFNFIAVAKHSEDALKNSTLKCDRIWATD